MLFTFHHLLVIVTSNDKYYVIIFLFYQSIKYDTKSNFLISPCILFLHKIRSELKYPNYVFTFYSFNNFKSKTHNIKIKLQATLFFLCIYQIRSFNFIDRCQNLTIFYFLFSIMAKSKCVNFYMRDCTWKSNIYYTVVYFIILILKSAAMDSLNI